MDNLRIIVGPPGTGKTNYLRRQIVRAVEKYSPEDIVACSYTKAAVRELVGRDLPIPEENIGTVHSIGYRALDNPELIETKKGIQEFLEEYPKFTTYFSCQYSAEIDELDVDSPAMAEFSLLRSRKIPLQAWPAATRHAYNAWCEFKKSREGIDYTDMISLPLKHGLKPKNLPKILFVDEAQDLTPLEVDLIHYWGKSTDQYFLIGDCDQSIYGFKGADPGLLNINGVEHRILSQSWRVPQRCLNIAQQIIRRNTDRVDVQYRPTDVVGEVYWHDFDLDDPAVVELANSLSGTVFILSSCSYMLQSVIKNLRAIGMPFENRFRRRRMDWNPLYQSVRKGAGIRSITRLNAFARCPYWTADDILLWAPMTKGVFGQQELEILRNLPQKHVLTAQQLSYIMGDEHSSGAVFDGLSWMATVLNKKYQGKLDYYFQLLKRYPQGYNESPRVTVGTIHSVKGGECDHVIISPDVSPSAHNWAELNRVYYVAVTRARQSVHLLAPSKQPNHRYLRPHIKWPESLTS